MDPYHLSERFGQTAHGDGKSGTGAQAGLPNDTASRAAAAWPGIHLALQQNQLANFQNPSGMSTGGPSLQSIHPSCNINNPAIPFASATAGSIPSLSARAAASLAAATSTANPYAIQPGTTSLAPFLFPNSGSQAPNLTSQQVDAKQVGSPVATSATPTATSDNNPTVEKDDHQSLFRLRERARFHVQEAIRTKIPAEKKAAYLKACEVAPDVVERETDPMQFVRFCKYNVSQAAERLCLYWEERLVLFGPSRAFLPLTVDGEGALDKDDILSLRAGFPALLPDNAKTQQQVVFCDRRQYLKTASLETRLKCVFYLTGVMARRSSDSDATEDTSESPSSSCCPQTDGVQLYILLIMRPRVQEFDREFVKKAFWLMANAFPVKFKIHLLNSVPSTFDTAPVGDTNQDPSPQESAADSPLMTKQDRKRRQRELNNERKKRFAVQDIMITYLQYIIDLGFKDMVEVHIERNPGELKEELLEMGLEEAGIPQCLGGSWKWEEFHAWCRAQSREEKKFVLEAKAASSVQTDDLTASNSHLPAATGTAISQTGFPAVAARAAAYAYSTSNNGETPNDTQQSGHAANDESPSKNAAAPDLANTKQRQQRVNNAIHSRRKRERRRQEFLDLQQNRDKVVKTNETLKEQNAELESLLQQALAIVPQEDGKPRAV